MQCIVLFYLNHSPVTFYLKMFQNNKSVFSFLFEYYVSMFRRNKNKNELTNIQTVWGILANGNIKI